MIRSGLFAAAMALVSLSAACAAQSTSDAAQEAPTLRAADISSPDALRADTMRGDSIDGKTRVAPATMADVQLSFAPIVDAAAPAVVNIFTKGVSQPRTTGDPFFDRFFGRGTPRQKSSLGSGVIVSPDGVVVTNNHVIEGMNEIKVVFADRREFEAELIFADPQTDLAVLRIDAGEPLPFLEFANSDAIEVGDVVLAIGNPFGVGQTVTSGIISALARTAVNVSDYSFFIQTDAAINPGNSGGALVDADGRLVGVNTAIYSRSGGSNGIGFAIPARLVRQVLSTAINGGVLERPWIGASTNTVTPDIARAFELDRPAGAIVEDVWKGGPADKAGLKEGDVIIEVDGQPIFDAGALRFRVGTRDKGQSAPVAYIRDGKRREASVTFTLPPDKPAPDPRTLEGEHPLNGVTVANLSPRFNEELGVDPLLTGVVVTELSRRSFASRQGLRTSHRILSVNGKSINTAADLEREISKSTLEWEIQVDTGERIVPWRVDNRPRTRSRRRRR
ncbi:MAG: DegQ family serine endoprotease [Pseudomonadota bacterium]